MKKIFILFFISFVSFSNYVEKYANSDIENVVFSEAYAKYASKSDNYVVVQKSVYAKAKAFEKAKNIFKIPVNSKVELLALCENNGKLWYEIKYKNKIGYILKKSAIQRKFCFENGINEAEEITKFLEKFKDNLRVVDCYRPLNLQKNTKKDKFGNSGNQSIISYTSDKKQIFNLQDRTILALVSSNEKDYNIIVDKYPKLLLSKKYAANLKKINLREVRKFIYVDRKNQNQFVFEKDPKTNKYIILSVGFVTTGKNSKYGFETPYGNFLVAISKPVMTYTSDIDTTKIIGDAKRAIRFSGGAYIHGIPSLYEPKENRSSRIAYTQTKLGTYPLSHKCVRNHDEVMKKLYEWVGVSSVNKNGHRTPKEPVIVIVR